MKFLSMGWWSLVSGLGVARLAAANAAVYLIGGRRYKAAFAEGTFRQGGEVHRVMYDRAVLGHLLESCGFAEPKVFTAGTSRIPDFDRYELDRVGGAVRKPDSLFMEAVRR
jgi:hypothetical protein